MRPTQEMSAMTEASTLAPTTRVTTSGRFLHTATEIAVIDTALTGWRDLLAGLPAGVEAVLIGEGRDGVAAMAQALAGLHGIRALHVLCHGFEGGLQLGTARLDEASLTAREAELTAIGACLAQDGDILLYGCNVASGHGESFLDALADITGAAMAASRTLTGAAELGGDWDLAWMRGTVRTEALRIEQYRGVLAAPFFDLAVAYTGENTITLKYEDTLDSTSNPLLTHFVATDGTVNAGTGSILINGTAVALISAVVSDNLVTLTVGQQFQLNDSIAFRYEDPAGDDATGVIQAPYGLDTFSVDVSVTVLSARPPAFLSSSAQSGGNKVVLSFDQALDENNPPSIQQFFGSSTTSGQIRINGIYYNVSGVDVIGSNVIVEVGNGYIFQSGDAVSLRYYDGDTVDSTTAIQNQGGVDIPDFRTSFTVQLHAPTLTAAGGTPTYSGSQTQPLFSSATASTNDSGQIFTAMTVTVTGMLDGVNEALYFTVPGMMGSLELYLVDGASHFIDPVQMSGTRVTGTVSVSNGTATIRITGMALSDAEMASLINDITYYNAAGTPSDGQRIIAVTGLTDDGGSVDTGDITGVSATINVGTPASSLPTLTATSTAPTYIQNAAPVDLFSGVAADTNDIGQVFTGLTLTVTNVVDVEWLSLDGIIPISLSSNATGVPVTAPGLTGAVLTTSYSGTTATVTLSGFSLTGTQLAALIDGIAYVNAGDAVNGIVTPGNRVVTITSVTDDGASNNIATLTGVSATVSVAGASTTSIAPTVTLTTEDTYGQSVALGTVTADLFDGVTASTVDGGQTFTGMVLTVHGVLFGANERLTVGGSSITLTAGTGVFSKGNYAVTVVNGVATVTLSGMSLTDGEMNALIDDLGYACDNAGLGMAPSDQFALTDTRSIVLRSITDSGASNNTTMVNKVATVSLGQKDSQSPMITVTPNNPTVTFAPGTTTAVSFTVTVATAATVGDGALFFNVKAPDGLTISNVKMNGGMPVFAFGASPGTYTLTFNVTTTGTTTSGAFPISITAGYSDSISPIPTIAVKSGSTMVTIAEPAPVLQSAAVDGTTLVLTYDMALDGTNIPAANAFAVQIGGNTVSVTNVAVDGANKTVTLTLGQAVSHTDTVTVAYTDPTTGDDTNAVQSTTGADAATFAAQAVTNNTINPNGTPPTLTLTPVDGYGQLVMGDPTFDLFDTVTASTVDSGQTFTGMVLTVHHVAGTGSNEFLNIAGTDITLSDGTSGSLSSGNYAVTLVNGVATVTLSGMALSNSAMSTLIDGIIYKTTAFTVSSLSQTNPGFSETRPIVLRSITDSGAANNTTEVNKLVTASFGMQPGSLSPITITPDNPTATFASGTPTQLSFTVNISTALNMVGSNLHFDVAAPSGWTIANFQLNGSATNTLTGIIPIGVQTLTFDVTASGTSGNFPISIFTSTSGMIPQASVSSGSVLVTLAPPAPVLQSAAVDGTTLVLTYDVALDAVNGPAAGAFVVKAGGNTITVTGVAVDSAAKTVTLTLGQAVQQGQTVTVSYTDPTSGNDAAAIQNVTGGADAATVTDQSVTNNTPDTTPPSITNVTIPDQAAKVGDTVTVTITVASDSDTYTLGSGSTVNGFTLGNLTKVSATTYTATFTVTADGQRTGDRAAADDIPVNIVLVDSASNANTPYTTPISQTNDRIDTNAPPTLVVPTTPPTLVDTAADDSFPMVDGQLSASDLEGDTLSYSIAGSQASPLQYGSVTLSNGVTYDIWSTGPGGTSYVNSQTGHYAYVFDAVFLNGMPAGPIQAKSTFTVSDGNRSVSQELTLNFTGANDSPILSNDVRSLTTIDQGIADAANSGMTVTALLASAGTATDAEYDLPVPMVTVLPLGIAVTGVTNTNGTWQYKVGTGAWTDIPTGSSNGSALLLAGSDRVRFVPSGSGFTNTDTGGLTFKAWDLTSGTAGGTADTSADAYSTGSATATITVDAVPTLTATGGAKTFGVGVDSSTSLFSGVAASTVEAGQSFRGAVFTVSGVVDATEVLTIGGTDIALTNGATGTLTGLGAAGGDASVTVSVVGGVATVTVSGLERSDAQMSALLGGVTYKNTSGTATLGNRTVAIASLTDSGGATGSATISGVSTVVSVADVTPPAVPVITSAALTNSATPTLAGTAEADSTVTVTIGGATYTTTATNGSWSINLATETPTSGALNLNANGTNAVSVTAKDASNNTSTPGTQTLTIDTTLPNAPVVTSAALTKNATPTLTGTAEAGSTVTVQVGGATYTAIATGGTWSIDLATATPTQGSLSLNPNGANTVSATATDTAGNVSAPAIHSLVIDTTAPNAPTVTTALSNSTTPTLTGTAEADSTVTVTIGGATYTAIATGGTWSIDLATATPTQGSLSLNPNGANTVSATATDAAGNVSGPGTQSLTIDTTAPTATVLFEDDSIDAIEQSSAGFTIANGEAGAAFTWTITSAGGGQVTGTGVMSGPTMKVTGLDLSSLGDGTLTLTLGLTDPAGNASVPFIATTQKLTATVEKPAPIAPVAEATVDGATVTGSVTTGGDGSRTTTVTVAATNSTRVEDGSTANPDLADVPVVREVVVDRQTGQVSTMTTLTVSVSNGVAVTTTGNAERQTASQALTGLNGLIAAIEARTDEGTASRGNLTGGGSGFLSVLSTQAQLLVRTIDFSAPGVAAGQTVQTKVTGTTLGGTGTASTAPTAVVLNTTALAGPVTIQLDNVEFAAVVGNATLVGGDGEQIVYGDDHEQYMHLGAGDDILHGGGGNDTITSAGGNDTLYGDDGDDVVHGGEGDDWLLGGSGNDLVGGGVGNDALFGGTGHDILFGEEGDDTLAGEEGDDTLAGGAGNDLLNGGAGNDVLFADGGADTLWGGAGADVFAFGRSSGGSVVMDFQVGVDRLALYDASMDLGAVIRSARVEGGNTTLDVGAGNRITILGQTGNVAGWFG
ncbi:DUF4347 domain-containing protein [Azospirillum formosense]|uniref:DUF4347 domain-containing protein n=2 Tax=Azospirillum formosense TaxID=861533 RepID=A0ABX2KQB9_9PROT|nr:DUF4347 domain-containing protein [Azospirillum formosense]